LCSAEEKWQFYREKLAFFIKNMFDKDMFIRCKKRENDRIQIQIVENDRDPKTGNVIQKLIRNIGIAHTSEEVTAFRKIGEKIIVDMNIANQNLLSFVDPVEFYTSKLESSRRKPIVDEIVNVKDLREEKVINEGFFEVFQPIMEEIGLNEIITNTKNDKQWNSIIQDLVIARIKDPSSKLATMNQIKEDFDIDIPYQKIYRSLDYLIKEEFKVKRAIANHTFNLLDKSVDVLFFDVTTLYFESIESDELREFGFSKDCKFNQVQVMLALIATKEGLPVSYKLFPGNSFEGNTLPSTIEELSKEFCIDRFIFVADRGMFSENNLQYMESKGYKFIVAAKLKTLKKNMKKQILSSVFKPTVFNNEFYWREEFKIDEDMTRRLIVSYNSKRAKKDFNDRQRLIDRILKKVKNNTIKVKDLISNHGSKKYVKIVSDTAIVNYDKMVDDEKWDGLHGIITNDFESNVDELLARYRGLWQIEEVFRVNKNFLRMRPIFHWKPRRIQAHVLLCFMSYSVLKFFKFKLKSKNIKLSIQEIRNVLNKVNSTIVRAKKSKRLYAIPSHERTKQRELYSALGIKRNLIPYPI
jgi:transposase